MSTPLGLKAVPKLGKPALLTPFSSTAPDILPVLSSPQSNYVVRHHYLTDIITSRQGREQRRALRGTPRREISLQTILTKQRWLNYTRFITKNQNITTWLAMESRVVLSTSDLTTNSFTVGVVPNWLVADQAIILFLHGVGFLFARVLSVVGTTVTLTSTVATTFAAGARVFQALLGRMGLETQRTDLAFDMTSVQIDFAEDPGSAIDDFDVPAATTWNSREVFLFTPNRFVEIQITDTSVREDVDYQLGAMQTFNPVTFPHRMFVGTYGMRTDLGERFRAMFDRMRGRWGEFYMPTFEPDLTVKTTATSGSHTLTIAGPDVQRFYSGSSVFKQVCVFLDNNPIPTVLFNTVNSIAINGSGDSVLTMANNWPQNITSALKISWMPVWRFATDILQMTWNYNTDLDDFVSVQPSFAMLEDL